MVKVAWRLGATGLEYQAEAFRIENGAMKALRRAEPIIHQITPPPSPALRVGLHEITQYSVRKCCERG